MKSLIAAVVVVLCVLAMPARAEEQTLEQLIRETQQFTKDGPQHLILVWWLPTEFWNRSAEKNPNVTPEIHEQLLSVVRQYTILAVLDARLSPLGTMKGVNEDEIAQSITIKSGSTVMHPLARSEWSSELAALLQIMKPLLSNMLGQMGQNTHFVVFDGNAPDGNRFADPTRPGRFTVTLGGSTFDWKLPLGAVLPVKFDPDTGDRFPGNYRYNPFSGKELSATRPSGVQTQN
jgi:hypothetical protein